MAWESSPAYWRAELMRLRRSGPRSRTSQLVNRLDPHDRMAFMNSMEIISRAGSRGDRVALTEMRTAAGRYPAGDLKTLVTAAINAELERRQRKQPGYRLFKTGPNRYLEIRDDVPGTQTRAAVG